MNDLISFCFQGLSEIFTLLRSDVSGVEFNLDEQGVYIFIGSVELIVCFDSYLVCGLQMSSRASSPSMGRW